MEDMSSRHSRLRCKMGMETVVKNSMVMIKGSSVVSKRTVVMADTSRTRRMISEGITTLAMIRATRHLNNGSRMGMRNRHRERRGRRTRGINRERLAHDRRTAMRNRDHRRKNVSMIRGINSKGSLRNDNMLAMRNLSISLGQTRAGG